MTILQCRKGNTASVWVILSLAGGRQLPNVCWTTSSRSHRLPQLLWHPRLFWARSTWRREMRRHRCCNGITWHNQTGRHRIECFVLLTLVYTLPIGLPFCYGFRYHGGCFKVFCCCVRVKLFGRAFGALGKQFGRRLPRGLRAASMNTSCIGTLGDASNAKPFRVMHECFFRSGQQNLLHLKRSIQNSYI